MVVRVGIAILLVGCGSQEPDLPQVSSYRYVAEKVLDAGHEVTVDDVRSFKVPGYLMALAEVNPIGRVLRDRVLPGEVLQMERLYPLGQRSPGNLEVVPIVLHATAGLEVGLTGTLWHSSSGDTLALAEVLSMEGHRVRLGMEPSAAARVREIQGGHWSLVASRYLGCNRSSAPAVDVPEVPPGEPAVALAARVLCPGEIPTGASLIRAPAEDFPDALPWREAQRIELAERVAPLEPVRGERKHMASHPRVDLIMSRSTQRAVGVRPSLGEMGWLQANTRVDLLVGGARGQLNLVRGAPVMGVYPDEGEAWLMVKQEDVDGVLTADLEGALLLVIPSENPTNPPPDPSWEKLKPTM